MLDDHKVYCAHDMFGACGWQLYMHVLCLSGMSMQCNCRTRLEMNKLCADTAAVGGPVGASGGSGCRCWLCVRFLLRLALTRCPARPTVLLLHVCNHCTSLDLGCSGLGRPLVLPGAGCGLSRAERARLASSTWPSRLCNRAAMPIHQVAVLDAGRPDARKERAGIGSLCARKGTPCF